MAWDLLLPLFVRRQSGNRTTAWIFQEFRPKTNGVRRRTGDPDVKKRLGQRRSFRSCKPVCGSSRAVKPA
jgi:hypothetical protein